MNARTEPALLAELGNQHLDALEEETIYILREVAAVFERPALLFSGGKDSLVLLHCAEKAFDVAGKQTVEGAAGNVFELVAEALNLLKNLFRPLIHFWRRRQNYIQSGVSNFVRVAERDVALGQR